MTSQALNLLLFLLVSLTLCNAIQDNFVHCMNTNSSTGYIEAFKYLHSPNSLSYFNLLQYAEQNPRWLNSTFPKPKLIITPYSVDQIRAAIICSKKLDFQIRVKSGGHDYEGLSFLCQSPFVLIDLLNLRSISIDLDEESAWVQSGSTLGELYYSIAQKSKIHGFPAGLCPSVGVGGHFSGGGLGTLLRKHGLAADNIIDAYVMDVEGKILDRSSMGEDLFWAIRGGGAASFGIIITWKIKLVRVPPRVTVFTVHKNLDQEGVGLVHKWQYISNKLPEDVFIRIVIQHIAGTSKGEQEKVEVLFNSLFLGPVNELLALMNKSFSELNLMQKDCSEMSWIESVLYFAGYQRDDPLEVLLDRTVHYKSYFKAKSDFVEKPIPEKALEGIGERLVEEDVAFVIMDPFGGKMEQIQEYETPFPHRKGNLFNIQYLVKWDSESVKHMKWIKMLYKYMKPYVSSSPRAAYINYRDLDLGINQGGPNTSYSEAVIWGTKYFKGNFKRLARVKKSVDPGNFFRNEQSVPLLLH